MTRIYRIALVTFVIICLLTSCSDHITPNQLAVCGSYCVPGLFCYDLKGSSYTCNVSDQDAYGRILFEYTAKSVISGEDETVYIVCQKLRDGEVYYYEDHCYSYAENKNVDVETLKLYNDWGKPLVWDRMSRRIIDISFDLIINTRSTLDYQSIRIACNEKLGGQNGGIDELCFLDLDYCGNELYYLCVNSDEDVRAYYVIINASYEISLLEIDDKEFRNTEIASFKKTAGWNYGIESVATDA